MAKSIDVSDLDIYYGDFKAVDDLTLEVAQLSLEAVGGWAVTTAAHGRRDCAGLAPSARTRSSWM